MEVISGVAFLAIIVYYVLVVITLLVEDRW